MRRDLGEWLNELGTSEAQIREQFNALLQENGWGATLVLNLANSMIPSGSQFFVRDAVGAALDRLDSGEFESWLLTQPEPEPEQLEEFLRVLKSGLSNLRQYLMQSGKSGPQHRRGGRTKKLTNPATREKLQQEIERLRLLGFKLQDVDQRLSKQYEVSASTIKRFRLSKKQRNAG